MGKVRDVITRRSKSKAKKDNTTSGVVERLQEIQEELSELCGVKEDDVVSEGDEQAPQNIKSAAQLRAAHALVTAATRILEDY